MVRRVRRLLAVTVAAVTVVGGVLVAADPAGAAPSPPSLTCSGGSIPAGTYSSVTVTGLCAVDSGDVLVQHSLVVAPNAGLNAAFGGSNLSVAQNLVVGTGAILVLGCEPEAFSCLNDDPDNPSLSTHDSVGGNLVADGALMMLVHANTIGGNVSQSGGGGGVTCDLFPLGPDGPPAYSTYEDNVIAQNASVTGVQTCWLGFIRNIVAGTVNYSGNVLADGDGNEVVSNTIGRNLNCSGNVPAPQAGDSGGAANQVAGRSTGQCPVAVDG